MMTKIEPEPIVMDDFETWLNRRPKWLQTAARTMIDAKRQLNEVEIKELARLCQLEAKGHPDPGFLSIVAGTLSQPQPGHPLELTKFAKCMVLTPSNPEPIFHSETRTLPSSMVKTALVKAGLHDC